MPNVPLATERAARKYGISPALLKALINQESGGNPNAVSPKGASGLAQFMPATAKQYNVNLHDGRITDDLEGAAHYLSDNLKRTGGNVTQALSIYNSGRPDGYKTIAETSHYVKTILAAARAHGGNAAGTSSPQAVSAPSSTTSVKYTPGTSTFEPDTTSNGAGLSDLIAAQLSGQRQQAAPAATLPDPSFSASKYVPTAALPQASGAMVKPRMDVGAVLQALEASPAVSDVETTPGKLTTSTTPSSVQVGPVAPAGGRVKGAKPGVPATHVTTVGGLHPTAGLPNFPAHDYMAPAGSATVAPVSGKVYKLSGHNPADGPTNGPHGPFGYSLYILGNDGRRYFLTHLGSRDVKVGQRVRQGQKIGTVGDYAKFGGANHIHMGVEGR